MQPNDQQGYYNPGQDQQPQPVPTGQPSAVDPAAVQAALNEPAPPTNTPLPEVERQDEEPEGADGSFEPVTWVAHEYIHQEKGTMWFVLFAVVVVILLGLSVWTQAWSFTLLILVIAVVVVMYSRRPPRELTYSLTDEGLLIDEKLHKFDSFKSFGIIRDGEEFSVMLIPTQRFQPGVTVYFPEEAGEAIVDTLGEVLPMKDLKLDAVDRVVRMLRL